MQDVVVLTMSEFGRAVAENGNRGTDHGHGNAMFALGGGMRGGKVYGRWPGSRVEQRFERRDLAVTTDFRDVFGEVVVRHLGVRDRAADLPRLRDQRGAIPGVPGLTALVAGALAPARRPPRVIDRLKRPEQAIGHAGPAVMLRSTGDRDAHRDCADGHVDAAVADLLAQASAGLRRSTRAAPASASPRSTSPRAARRSR